MQGREEKVASTATPESHRPTTSSGPPLRSGALLIPGQRQVTASGLAIGPRETTEGGREAQAFVSSPDPPPARRGVLWMDQGGGEGGGWDKMGWDGGDLSALLPQDGDADGLIPGTGQGGVCAFNSNVVLRPYYEGAVLCCASCSYPPIAQHWEYRQAIAATASIMSRPTCFR
ncbi:hypothetical protein Purlil1_9661 [Purpureocillium lilacinum]|uniref:Uncharacterized protein n=1 Tax=Purpureocillium lilacinum TaxID=33203 RepID=A0ABR0BPK3_PURLI|nr:hypothetical protein Purlil1_9661 [Purpureocillium lilacinum]